jgi:hypothetical protein
MSRGYRQRRWVWGEDVNDFAEIRFHLLFEPQAVQYITSQSLDGFEVASDRDLFKAAG